MKTKYYAGIGSRSTPPDILKKMTSIAHWLESKGYVLRSGGAVGADKAFEAGTDTKEIFYAKDATEEAMNIAGKFHPAWSACKSYIKQLHGRNVFQILGKDLDAPVDFVICWTIDGAETDEERSIMSGGTGTAISLASHKHIRVYNLEKESSIKELSTRLKEIK